MSIRICLCSLFFVATSAAGQTLTESMAVERGLSSPNVRELIEARLAENLGNAASAGLWANPEIEFSRETLDTALGDGDEDLLAVRQRFNLAGVRGMEKRSAASQRLADDARVELLEREISADIRMLFYTAVAWEENRIVQAAWQARLQGLASSIRERVRAGDASRYEQLRVERELALLEGDVIAAEAQAKAARGQLFARIGGNPDPLTGSLLPPAQSSDALGTYLEGHPLLVSLAREAESAELAAAAARRERWPELTLGLGHRELTEPGGGGGDGSFFLVGFDVPLFDRGQGKYRVANARARARRAEHAIEADKLAAELSATIQNLNARRNAARLLQPSPNATESLADIAEVAYEAGEIGIMELIDAHRADLQILTEFNSRALEARKAYINFQLLSGQP